MATKRKTNLDNVINLFDYRHEHPQETLILQKIIGNQQFEYYIKDLIEGLVFDTWANHEFSHKPTEDDPFDPIYIADLKPDSILADDIRTLTTLAGNIQDKSDSLVLKNGWDD